jgi:hypothetical protein
VAKLVVVSRKLAMGPAWAAWSVLRGLALGLLFGVLKLVSVWWSVAKLVVVSRRLAMGLAADLACLQAPESRRWPRLQAGFKLVDWR